MEVNDSVLGPNTGPAEVEVRNIGGIDETSVELEPGMTVLRGRNATNRTSFLQAIMAIHGSKNFSLKSDTDEGLVRLTVGETSYECRFERRGGELVRSGESILDDPEIADLFAFLLESNDARRAVEQGTDLREIIMRPIDTAAIEAEIAEVKETRAEIEDRLEELDERADEVLDLEAKRSRLEDELAETREELETKRAKLDASDESVDETREVSAELETILDDLWAARSNLEDVEYDLETERETVDSLEAELETLREKRDSLAEAPTEKIETLEARLDDLHDRKGSITTDLNRLQNVIQFNNEMLDGAKRLDLIDETESNVQSVTDQLVDGTRAVECWTCGSSVEKGRIEEMIETLQERRQEKARTRSEIDEQIESITDEKRELEEQQQRHRDLDRKVTEREDELERRKEQIDEHKEKRERLRSRINDLEDRVDALREQEQSEVLDLHETVTQLEYDVESLEDEIGAINMELATIEEELANRDDLRARREELTDELQKLRTRVKRTEESAIEAFNTHMDAVLEKLAYANVERTWIERTEREVREGNQKVTKGKFNLHIVRETDDGTAYEDTIENLSESEREVIGLVFALAGYLAHDVHETVPFMLLDSLEALDAERIAALLEYMKEFADNIVVALLPEDAAAIDDSHPRVTDI